MASISPNARDRLFETQHLSKGLDVRSARGGVITIASQAILFVLSMGSMMVLARLLSPEDFGLVAMVAVMTGILGVFRDGGLSMATVQREDITHSQVSVLFWLNTAISLGLTAIGVACSPLVAWIYGDSRLVLITCVTASNFLISGLGVQHRALATRQMMFGALASIEIIGRVLGVVVAILIAYATGSYWAILATTLVGSLVSTLGCWGVIRWLPGLPRRGTGVMPMVKFGGNMMGAAALNYVSRNADTFILGLTTSPSALGIYSRAYMLLLMPSRQILSPISSVTIPSLSRLTGEPDAFKRLFIRQAKLVTSMASLAIGFAIAAAPEVVAIVLGDQWKDAVWVFWFLSPGAFVSMTNISGSWVCATHGRPDRQRKIAMVVAPIYVVSFLIGSIWGVCGVAASYSIACVAMRHPAFVYALRGMPVSPADIWGLTIRPILLVVPMCVAGVLLSILWTPSLVVGTSVKLLMLVATGVIGVGVGWLPHPRAVINQLRKKAE
ncbi:lipopolysaccharide biosynthesis protein [Rhodopirellula sp. MGV]|uniref:lipopolysaccharide biosynthesis protein n=1 Tax=Rhodopirellula sp. MGV TaxID=2023130 RepID=UPI0013042627|nr:lipopolysaccharide biosynthesis protein [Rhodopirellula sp. MGV]